MGFLLTLYLTRIVRDEAKNPTMSPLREIVDGIHVQIAKIEDDLKLYDVVRKETWYRPDMFFYWDMLMMLARNKRVDEARTVWGDLKREEVHFDQHTFGDLIRAFLDSGLPNEAMRIYDDEMRRSPDPPRSLPYRVVLKGLIPYPELREKVKDHFLELFPDMIVYDPPEEDLFSDDQEWRMESEED